MCAYVCVCLSKLWLIKGGLYAFAVLFRIIHRGYCLIWGRPPQQPAGVCLVCGFYTKSSFISRYTYAGLGLLFFVSLLSRHHIVVPLPFGNVEVMTSLHWKVQLNMFCTSSSSYCHFYMYLVDIFSSYSCPPLLLFHSSNYCTKLFHILH